MATPPPNATAMPPPPPPPNAKPPPKPNPAFAAMGLPRLRAKLPSRNWSIFLGVCSVIGSTVGYDRYHTKLVKQKWIDTVSHLSTEPLEPMALPRKVTVYLAAPPGDGIQAAREHFRDYVKPLLNAAAVDFDVVEGRKMGELRYKVAEEIRGRRRGDEDGPVEEARKRAGIERVDEGGVIVVGRHAWKEYLRGVHEGWLGPLEAPLPTPPPPSSEMVMEAASPVVESLEDAIAEKTAAAVPVLDPKEEEKKKKEEEKKKKAIPAPFLLPSQYGAATMSEQIPGRLEAAAVVPFPHILGFLNTPIRMYRYVTRRHMADEVCREAAAVALGFHRPFITAPEPAGTLMEPEEVEDGLKATKETGEINALEHEEADWPSKVWDEERYKGEWTEGVSVDGRIRERLRRFFIPTDREPKSPGAATKEM
ncbi:mitochondrial import inner membrane translocase subunit Tim54 [Tricharina praecox]|uniref:mitochondrial import inner membrane translocase subunit Tim54 n=1 Tax=Tricharina praecox TaxID=43433 RepID=UPI00221FC7C2|nr:mitochondrial import inner membrane translocase subunit Tim54 [Tricharina praecox]KAI5855762.1 mitochondrial import inner membrane translocase subunit Tim54 [Tricharina praecox]